MKYEHPAAFRRALEDRLKVEAAARGIPVNRLRKLVTVDRILARLLASGSGDWVVKGGIALAYRLGAGARPTQDLDLWRRESEESVLNAMTAACALNLGDHFSFTITRGSSGLRELQWAATRFRLQADLAGRAFETIVVDVGGEEGANQRPDLIMGTNLLAFAGIDPFFAPILPLEQHVAEKLHAYTRQYGGMHGSSRVKDLIDLVLIASFASFAVERLRAAPEATFARRDTHPLPESLAEPPRSWTIAYRELANAVAVDPNVRAGHQKAANFLDPVLALNANTDARWDPLQGDWAPPLPR